MHETKICSYRPRPPPERHERGFHGKRSAPAHGIDKMRFSGPSCGTYDSGGQTLLHRRAAWIEPVAASRQRLAGRVDVQDTAIVLPVQMHHGPSLRGPLSHRLPIFDASLSTMASLHLKICISRVGD